MKKISTQIVLICLTITLIIGCNASKTAKGAAIGTAVGATAGAIIGNNVGDKNNSVLGAIIGGVVGGAAGAYIGNRMDRQAERIEQEIPGAEVTRVGEGINVTFDESSGIYFNSSKYDINATSQKTLNKLAGIFKEFPNSSILIEGHTDSDGSDSYNMTLSKKRAKSVTNYVVNQGISSKRFSTKWYGETQPKYTNDTNSGKAKNRRVELAIVANDELKKEAKQKAKN